MWASKVASSMLSADGTLILLIVFISIRIYHVEFVNHNWRTEPRNTVANSHHDIVANSNGFDDALDLRKLESIHAEVHLFFCCVIASQAAIREEVWALEFAENVFGLFA